MTKLHTPGRDDEGDLVIIDMVQSQIAVTKQNPQSILLLNVTESRSKTTFGFAFDSTAEIDFFSEKL